jgi:type IV pilus assembly protein PilW
MNKPMLKATLTEKFGFSIIELLIATMLALLLVSAILNVTLQGSRLSQQLRLRNEILETGRYLINSMDDQISHAGYYGPVDSAKIRGSVKADLCSVIGTDAIRNILNFPVDGLDNVPANYKVCRGERVLPNSDVLVIRHAERTPMAVGQSLIGTQHYIQALGDRYIIDRGANAVAFSLRKKDSAIVVPIRS